jgi:hypothetical protein
MEIDMSNVKNAPTARYFTEFGYSQCYPWVLIDMSPSGKTATLARVATKSDPDWTPKMLVGGFCGHCINQSEQTWLYDGVESRTQKIRLNKYGEWKHKGVRFEEEKKGPYYFYDYNF